MNVVVSPDKSKTQLEEVEMIITMNSILRPKTRRATSPHTWWVILIALQKLQGTIKLF